MSDGDLQQGVQAQQLALLRRVDQIVHWQKHALRYRGSKDTAEIGGMVVERLIRRDTYRRVFSTRPGELWGMLRRVAHNAIVDLIRAHGAQKNQRPTAEPAQRWARTPSLHAALEHRECLQAIRCELERFRTGEAYAKAARPELRARMAAAFEQHYFEGAAHAAIAAQMGTSKATVGNWLEFVRLQLARRIAEHERSAGLL
jgi:DNA-directed RNA polymerase specialized sigma24 family protein